MFNYHSGLHISNLAEALRYKPLVRRLLVFFIDLILPDGPGSSVGIATGYGLDGPRIESRWGEIFRTFPDRPWAPPYLLYNRYWVFSGGRGGWGVLLNPTAHLVPRS